ncbi:MAG: thermonuclease family protein [Candidatus Omnitrophota bacterium]|nr:thermonuclease family protein [Candidatus Omnitrophota bacterium]
MFQKKRSITKKEFKYIFNIIALLIVGLLYFGIRYLPKDNLAAPVKDTSIAYVTKAIDGDTLKLSTGEHVRLIGIDTPESRYNNKLERDSKRSRKDMEVIIKMGKEAESFTRRLTQNKRLRLEYDLQRYDKYKRLLAYVYLEDGTFVNAKIIEEGYAQAMTIPPNVKYSDMFFKLQKSAMENGRGLWKENTGKELF